MAESFSFDVVSDFDRQELVNTLDQVKREISQRYDLKGTDTSVDLEKEIEKVCWRASHEDKHGVLPSEYDIREIEEDLYLQLLQEFKSNI